MIPTALDYSRARKMRADGLRDTEVAERLGRSYHSVRSMFRYMAKWGQIEKKTPKQVATQRWSRYSPERKQEIMAMLAANRWRGNGPAVPDTANPV